MEVEGQGGGGLTPEVPIVLHHLNNSRSHRIIWLLEELKVNYTIKQYMRGSDMLAPKELSEVHPLGKSPVITDGPHTIAESGAIIEYLVDKYGPQLKPGVEDTEHRLHYTFWLHYAEGSLMSPLLMKLIFDATVTRSPFFIRPIARGISSAVHASFITPNLKKHFAFVEKHLETNEYFCGDKFSAADIQMSFPIQAGNSRGSEHIGPKTKEWLAKVEGRDAYKVTLEKGGKYDL